MNHGLAHYIRKGCLQQSSLCTNLWVLLKITLELLNSLPLLDIDLLNLKTMRMTSEICEHLSTKRHATCSGTGQMFILTRSNLWPSSSRRLSASLARASNNSPFLTWSSKSFPSLSICPHFLYVFSSVNIFGDRSCNITVSLPTYWSWRLELPLYSYLFLEQRTVRARLHHGFIISHIPHLITSRAQ
jgi:hypothetical protein